MLLLTCINSDTNMDSYEQYHERGKMNSHTATDGAVLHTSIDDALQALNTELCKVIGLGVSVHCIGQDLPATPIGEDDAICPELVFPALACGLLQHANRSLSIIEKLQDLLREQGGAA